MQLDTERIAYPIAFTEHAAFKDTYGGSEDLVLLESYLSRPIGRPSSTVLVFMHPVGGGAYLPIVGALARAGHHVIYCNSRYRGVDSALIMEKVVLDLGAAIRDAKDRLGYERVVLVGWSGADNICVPSHAQAMYDAIPHPDKELVGIPGATHYYMGPGQRERLNDAVALCTTWLETHDFSSA